MFGFIKKNVVFYRINNFIKCKSVECDCFGATPLRAAPLKCASMTNQECKVRPEIVNVNSDEPVFILLVLNQVNAVVVATISMIHMQKCVFLML